MTTRLRTIDVDEFFPHPPSLVWRALTEPELIGQWLMPNDFEPRVGHRFTMRTDPVPAIGFLGVIECEVLALEPERLLSISWTGGPLENSTVTWRLQPEGRGTRMLLEHAGFDPDDPQQLRALEILGSGWRSHVLQRMREVVSSLHSAV